MHVSIQALEKGPVSNIKVVESEKPDLEPTNGQVLVQHLASGVAFADGLITNGLYPTNFGYPVILGYDFVAKVLKSGDSNFKPGDTVVGMPCVTSWQTTSIQSTKTIVKCPDNVDPADAVCGILNYVTAYQMMERIITLKDGDAVLVHSASGGVGQSLLDLLKTLHPGVKVFGTASAGKKELVESMGATWIDYKNQDFVQIVKKQAPEGVVLAFDAVGYDNMKKSYSCLSTSKPSNLVIYGFTNDAMSGSTTSAAAKIAINIILPSKLSFWGKRNVSFYSVASRRDSNPQDFKQDLSKILNLMSEGKLKPTIHGIVPFTSASHALEFLQSGKSRGKIVLAIDQSLQAQYKSQGRLLEKLE